ncbi:hypothetical protein MKW94_026762 [Papaver nudicaule]|uniref:Defensin-like protein n=1 Tax=Papaver nudicaule TaxID=74823 RepID=A0AA42B215_PAPNU|nr:hypothetical protein [Papaver nudicaule]
MAKAHLSLSPFLVGFLLVLFVAEIGYVHGENLCPGLHHGWKFALCSGENSEYCDEICISGMDFPVSHTFCSHGFSCVCCGPPL